MKVKLIRKSRNNWNGIVAYPNCYQHIAPYLTRAGLVYTGLLDKLEEEDWSKKLGGLDLRRKVEGKDGLIDNPYWSLFSIPIGEEDLLFDTEVIQDAFRVNFLKKHKDVANGYADKKPGANYILIEAQATAEEDNKRNLVKIQAITEYNKLTTDQMRKALRVFGYNSSNITNEIAQSVLFKFVENEPKKFVDLWVNNKDKDVLYLIEEAISKNIIRKNKNIYKYGTDTIGYNLDDTIEYLKNPGNSVVRLAIQAALEGKYEVEQPAENRSENLAEYKQILTTIEASEKLPEEYERKAITLQRGEEGVQFDSNDLDDRNPNDFIPKKMKTVNVK